MNAVTALSLNPNFRWVYLVSPPCVLRFALWSTVKSRSCVEFQGAVNSTNFTCCAVLFPANPYSQHWLYSVPLVGLLLIFVSANFGHYSHTCKPNVYGEFFHTNPNLYIFDLVDCILVPWYHWVCSIGGVVHCWSCELLFTKEPFSVVWRSCKRSCKLVSTALRVTLPDLHVTAALFLTALEKQYCWRILIVGVSLRWRNNSLASVPSLLKTWRLCCVH